MAVGKSYHGEKMVNCKPEILNRSVVTKSRFFTVEAIHLRFSNGEERDYERVIGQAMSGSVMIVPILDNETILLAREYGAGVESYTLGFPKGMVDPGEDLLETANRELQEELGYGARALRHLTRFSLSPGYMGSMMDIVLAQDLYVQRRLGDEPEPIECVPWRLDAVDELLQHPEFHEARSVAALLWLVRINKDIACTKNG